MLRRVPCPFPRPVALAKLASNSVFQKGLTVAARLLRSKVEVCMPRMCGGRQLSSCMAEALLDRGSACSACRALIPRTGRLKAAAALAAGTLQQSMLQSWHYQTQSPWLQVTGEQLLDSHMDIALQFNRHPREIVCLSNGEVASGSYLVHVLVIVCNCNIRCACCAVKVFARVWRLSHLPALC